MTALQHSVRLHETTVQGIARGEVKRYQIRQPRPSAVSGGMSYIRVHPLVMEAAKALIDSGSYTRIEIIDDRTVMVR